MEALVPSQDLRPLPANRRQVCLLDGRHNLIHLHGVALELALTEPNLFQRLSNDERGSLWQVLQTQSLEVFEHLEDGSVDEEVVIERNSARLDPVKLLQHILLWHDVTSGRVVAELEHERTKASLDVLVDPRGTAESLRGSRRDEVAAVVECPHASQCSVNVGAVECQGSAVEVTEAERLVDGGAQHEHDLDVPVGSAWADRDSVGGSEEEVWNTRGSETISDVSDKSGRSLQALLLTLSCHEDVHIGSLEQPLLLTADLLHELSKTLCEGLRDDLLDDLRRQRQLHHCSSLLVNLPLQPRQGRGVRLEAGEHCTAADECTSEVNSSQMAVSEHLHVPHEVREMGNDRRSDNVTVRQSDRLACNRVPLQHAARRNEVRVEESIPSQSLSPESAIECAVDRREDGHNTAVVVGRCLCLLSDDSERLLLEDPMAHLLVLQPKER
mmetsp:Transcript_15188/g.59437  ORF Transcript_15188/g.59437 Transcript_15188/m.59437 type:complete len:442 (-) Transcript_15188:744-2069(-)